MYILWLSPQYTFTYNYTKQHLHIYTCTRVYIIYMCICKRDYVQISY